MNEFKELLFTWNNWIVFPALTLVTLVLHYRCRKRSTLILCVGMLMLLASKILKALYSNPLSSGYFMGMVCGIIGLVISIIGVIWFFRKDYAKRA
jgi:uncharacterized membrane protein HdeD (DUF308 family)